MIPMPLGFWIPLGGPNYTTACDPLWEWVVAALPMDGANGSTTYTNYGSAPVTFTRAAGTGTISTAQSAFGGASANFNSDTYLSCDSNSNMALGTNDFTVDFWFRVSSVSTYQRLITSSTGSITTSDFCVSITSGAKIEMHNNGTWITSSNSLAINTWYYCAVSRVGGNAYIFINGALWASGASTADYTNAIRYIGGYNSSGGTEYCTGYMDDVRITNGVARYTIAFTNPPVTNYLYTCNPPYFDYEDDRQSQWLAYSNGAGGTVTRTSNYLEDDSYEIVLSPQSNGYPLITRLINTPKYADFDMRWMQTQCSDNTDSANQVSSGVCSRTSNWAVGGLYTYNFGICVHLHRDGTLLLAKSSNSGSSTGLTTVASVASGVGNYVHDTRKEVNMRWIAQGTSHKVYVNDVLKIDTTISDHSTVAGNVGFFTSPHAWTGLGTGVPGVNKGYPACFDNLVIEAL